MKLRQLEYFVAAAEELHFGRAAARMGVSQPSLTEQIQRLERHLEAALFDRDSHTVELTTIGELLFDKARATLASAACAAQVARNCQGATEPDLHGTLRIGFCCSATRSVVPAAVRAYAQRHPATVLTLQELWTREQLEDLIDHRLDAAFVLGPVDDPRLQSIPVMRDRFVAVLPADHRLARPDRIHADDLTSAPLVLFRRELSPVLYDNLMFQLTSGGRALDIVHEVDHPNAIPLLAATGAVGLMSTARADQVHIPGLVTRRITGIDLEEDIHMVWRVGESNAATEKFVSLVTPLHVAMAAR